MNRILLLVFVACSMVACKKDSSPNVDNSGGGTNNKPTYMSKTIGISRIRVVLDDNNQIAVAELYGGGNRVILKPGTGNKIEFIGSGYIAPGDASAYPDALLDRAPNSIDNGNPPDTINNSADIFKIRGFDRAKAGYDQLNLVVCQETVLRDVNYPGYATNLDIMRMNKPAGKKASDYDISFIRQLFDNVSFNITTLEIAPPLSAKPYTIHDEIIGSGTVAYAPQNDKIQRVDLSGQLFRALFTYDISQLHYTVGPAPKVSLVHADNATLEKSGDYRYQASFTNIKSGDMDQIVEPSDTTGKMFIRISGLDPKVCGFNEYRLFLHKDALDEGLLRINFTDLPKSPLAMSFFNQVFQINGLYCNRLR